MAYVLNHLFGPIQVPLTLWITPKLHHLVDPYLPKFLTTLQQYIAKRIADIVGPDVVPTPATTATTATTKPQTGCTTTTTAPPNNKEEK